MNNHYTNIVDWGILTAALWNDPIGWFLELSLFFQVLIVIGLIAITIASLVLAYYILKGVAYLLYYLFKGLYHLFKVIYTGLSKLFEELSYAISGKPRKKDQGTPSTSKESIGSPEYTSHLKEIVEEKIPYYCTECGQKITDSLNTLLTERGVAFCFFCGKEFKLKKAETS